MYTESLIEGATIRGEELRSATIRGYLSAANALFAAKGFPAPVDLSRPDSCHATSLIENVKTWENEPNRRTHMTPLYLRELMKRADDFRPTNPDSWFPVMVDWILLGRYTGFRIGEFGQSTQKKIDYFSFFRGRHRIKIMKAFQRSDFVFFDIQGRRITNVNRDAARIHRLQITWRVQKNRRNGQRISWYVDHAQPALCPVQAAIRIVQRSLRWQQPDEGAPLGFYLEGRGAKRTIRFITGAKIRESLRTVAKNIYPDLSKRELAQFSAHMIRVTACVLLQQAGKSPDYVRSRLRWESEAYRVYLRDTSTLALQHLESVGRENQQVLDAYAIAAANLPAQPTTPPPPPDQDMGVYDDLGY